MNREWIVLIVLVYGDSVWAQPPVQPVVTELDGYWHRVSQQRDAPPGVREWDVLVGDAFFVADEQFHSAALNGTFGPGPRRVPIVVDATRSPKTVDFKAGNVRILAIYKIENDVLTLATQHSTETRPSVFTTSPDAGPGRAYHVYVYKLIKENAEEAKAKTVGPLDPKAQNIDGLWALEKTEGTGHWPDLFDGQEAIYFEGGGGMLASKDGWHAKDSPAFKFTFKSDPQAKPPTLEAKLNRGLFRGIYKIVGDDLTIASNASNADLPRWFSTGLATGAGRADELRRYRRVHPTPRIVELTQPAKLDAAKQSLDGFWYVEYDRPHRHGPSAEAYWIEGGKWLPATLNGTLLKSKSSELASFVAVVGDATKPMPTIDLTASNGERIRGIYKVEGDRLYLAANLRDEERPKSFTTNLTAGAARAKRVVLLRRGDVNQTCVPAPGPNPFSADLASPMPKPHSLPPSELNGYWILEKRITKGRDNWKAHWEHAVYIEGRNYHFIREDGLVARQTQQNPALIRVDETTSPKTIVYLLPQSNETWRGIYKVEGKKLIVATNFLADRWPNDFSTMLDAKPEAKPETKLDGKPFGKLKPKPEAPQPQSGLFEQVRIYSLVEERPEGLRQKAIPTLEAAAQRLDGLWILKDHEANPTRDVGDYPFGWEEAIYVEGNRCRWIGNSGSVRFHEPKPFRSDPKALPPALDVQLDGKHWRGIYKIEGDRLTIAYGGPNVDRPRWFTTKLTAGLGRANFQRIYVRAQPTAEVAHLTSKVKLDKAKQKLDGLWIVERQSQNGSIDGQLGFRVDEAIYFDDGHWQSASKAGKVTDVFKAKYLSDASSDVPKIDLTIRKTHARGIYKVEGDTLYLALNFSHDSRPCVFTTDLTAGPGRATFAAVLKRAVPLP